MKETIIKTISNVLNKSVESPTRALTTVFLSVMFLFLAIITTIFIDHRSPIGAKIVSSIGESRFIAKLDESKFNSEISHLIRRSGAAGATIWSVNLAKPTRKIIYSATASGGAESRKELLNFEVELYGSNPKTALAIIDTQQNEVACTDVEVEDDYDETLSREKITYICAISIPPDYGQYTGLITLEFTSKKDVPPLIENYLNFAARRIVKY